VVRRSAGAAGAATAVVAAGAVKGTVGLRPDMIRGVPSHTPLASVLHQYKEAEVAWAHEKVCERAPGCG
jgi:hypothetical protein